MGGGATTTTKLLQELELKKNYDLVKRSALPKYVNSIVARKLGKGPKMLSFMSSILSNNKFTKAQGL
jgi:hypothetical protein